MKNNIFVYFMFLFVTILHAQNNTNSFEIADIYDGEMEELLNKSYKDSLKKANKTKKIIKRHARVRQARWRVRLPPDILLFAKNSLCR